MTPMRNARFRVGQRVRIKRGASYNPKIGADVRGEVFTVLELPGAYPYPWHLYYTLDGKAADGDNIGAQEHALEPVYDGDTPSTWDEFERLTGFNPTRVAA